MDENLVELVVEIPAGSRNKYEYDHEHHRIRLDRRLFSATVYPADYGFVPDTLAEDGDPLDAMVLLQDPTFPGCMVRARVLGIFWMQDEAGPDAKLITVLPEDPAWNHARDIGDVPAALRNEIQHFFSVYKDLDPGKHSSSRGFGTCQEAIEELARARDRFDAARDQEGRPRRRHDDR